MFDPDGILYKEISIYAMNELGYSRFYYRWNESYKWYSFYRYDEPNSGDFTIEFVAGKVFNLLGADPGHEPGMTLYSSVDHDYGNGRMDLKFVLLQNLEGMRIGRSTNNFEIIDSSNNYAHFYPTEYAEAVLDFHLSYQA